MESLNFNELISINGGNVTTPPVVSDDPSVQSGYNFGYRFGRAIGATVKDFTGLATKISDAVRDFF